MEELVAQNNSIQSTIIQSKTYLQVLPVTLSNDSYSVRINALLDCRADSTLVREDIAKILHIKGEQKSLKTQCIRIKVSKFYNLLDHHQQKI